MPGSSKKLEEIQWGTLGEDPTLSRWKSGIPFETFEFELSIKIIHYEARVTGIGTGTVIGINKITYMSRA